MSEPLIIAVIAYPLTALVTWALARRKNDLDYSAKICVMWKDLSEGMEKRFKEEIEDLKKQNVSLEKQVKEVLSENVTLRNRVFDVEQENQKLTIQLQNLNDR